MHQPESEQTVFDRAADLLRSARSVLFITGAGMSADSGLPTYRGIGGLYEQETTEEGYPIEVALSGEMLLQQPALCWKYIRQIEEACRGAQHNRGHEIIARFEERFERCWVLTQNVDGFHRDAGSKNIIEVHGDIHRLVCLGCGRREQVADYAELPVPPSCPDCGGLVRPRVVLFGEMLPEQAVLELHRQSALGFDVVFSIGTTSAFPYIAQPVLAARGNGGAAVEINPGFTEVSSRVDVRIPAGAAASLEAIWMSFQRGA